jgi:hypothetical protein
MFVCACVSIYIYIYIYIFGIYILRFIVMRGVIKIMGFMLVKLVFRSWTVMLDSIDMNLFFIKQSIL